MHQALGDEAFFAALRTYAETYAFGIATPADLRRILTQSDERKLDALWRRWFEENTRTVDDVHDLLQASAR